MVCQEQLVSDVLEMSRPQLMAAAPTLASGVGPDSVTSPRLRLLPRI